MTWSPGPTPRPTSAAYRAVVPLLVIVSMFAVTLGQRKLSSDEGRLLKLMSGPMMTGLGLIMMFAPALLNQVGTTLVLLAAVLTIAAAGRHWLRSNSARLSKAPDDR